MCNDISDAHIDESEAGYSTVSITNKIHPMRILSHSRSERVEQIPDYTVFP